jgi:hypothetical protein
MILERGDRDREAGLFVMTKPTLDSAGVETFTMSTQSRGAA